MEQREEQDKCSKEIVIFDGKQTYSQRHDLSSDDDDVNNGGELSLPDDDGDGVSNNREEPSLLDEVLIMEL